MSDMFLYCIKIFVLGIYVYFICTKIDKSLTTKIKLNFKIYVCNFIISIICTYIKFYKNSFVSILLMYTLHSFVLLSTYRISIINILINTLFSFALVGISFFCSLIFSFFIKEIFNIISNYISLVIILSIQFGFIYYFLKLKKFKYGFKFLNKKIENDLSEIIIINISIIVVIVYCLLGTGYDEITISLIISFIILGFSMFIMIQKTLTMHYKQKLLEDNLKFFENEVKEKEKEIEKLKNEKYNISKITHEFFNRQKALELKVAEETNNKTLSERIHKLNQEYMAEIGKFKTIEKLPKTEIEEIDDMFKYMQSECTRYGIKYGLKIEGNIHYLINNIIPKNRLETLIGDHIRDAINAVNKEEITNKEILVILGIKEEKYELCILDTGVEFSIQTLLKLGKENVTTNEKNGGTGMGFITTFETMKKTGASLIIEEFENTTYTKAVKIRFDGKNEYKIISYRAQQIENINTNRGDCIVIYK